MAQLLAKIVAGIAIYSIAVQTLLLGYLHARNLGVDPVAVICRGDDGSGKHDRPSSPHGGTCDPCALACNGICVRYITSGREVLHSAG